MTFLKGFCLVVASTENTGLRDWLAIIMVSGSGKAGNQLSLHPPFHCSLQKHARLLIVFPKAGCFVICSSQNMRL